MNILYTLSVIFREIFARDWLFQEESIVHITSRMTLRLEKSIEVPERAFYELTCWHFVEAHFEENFTELSAYLKKRVQMTTIGSLTLSIKIVFLELSVFPCSASNHINCEISLHLLSLRSEIRALGNLIALVGDNIDKLSFLHLFNDLFVMSLKVIILSIFSQ
jgi:hypothetical protein